MWEALMKNLKWKSGCRNFRGDDELVDIIGYSLSTQNMAFASSFMTRMALFDLYIKFPTSEQALLE
jgi:hypothetical protein